MKTFDHTKLNKEDFSFIFGYYGYMIQYKGKDIGGAGCQNKGKKLASNFVFYRDQAKITIRNILNGRCALFMQQKIIEIDNEIG